MLSYERLMQFIVQFSKKKIKKVLVTEESGPHL